MEMNKTGKKIEKDPTVVNSKKDVKEIAKTWISGARSVTMILERKIAEEYGLTEPSHVVLERTRRGILIRRLDLGAESDGE